MADLENKTYYCERCNKTMSEENFYTSNNMAKYQPDGKLHMCKKCATARINNWDPDTYLWILQEIDVPYVPDEWNKLMAKYAVDRSKTTGTTIIENGIDIDDDISAVIRCISYDIDFTTQESILKSQIYCQVNPLVSFVSLENQCIFSVYDDRGCDIVFFSEEKYKEFYIKLEQYFLDYDREKMRKTFNSI